MQKIVLTLIVINAVVLGMETSKTFMSQFGPVLVMLDNVILTVFVVEIVLRVYAHGRSFFRDPWSLLDITVVAISLLPASGAFSVLRALRVLRVLRILTVAPSMRRVVGGLVAAIPGMSSIAGVMVLLFYVAAVIATHLFGSEFDAWFGTIGRSLYSLFQIMTLESWSMGIVRPVMEVYPYAWAFFVPFILTATFTMLNLVIGVIVGAMQSADDAAKAEEAERTGSDGTSAAGEATSDVAAADVKDELRAIRAELAALRTSLTRKD